MLPSRRSSVQNVALLGVGDVEAAGAEAHLGLGLGDRAGEAGDVVGRDLQQVEGDPLRRLRPDAGKATELVDQRLDRRRVRTRHVSGPVRRARTRGTPRPGGRWWSAPNRAGRRRGRRGRCRRRPAVGGAAVVGAGGASRTISSMVIDRPRASAHACSTTATCSRHLARWVALGAASVIVSPAAVTTSTGVNTARAIPFNVGFRRAPLGLEIVVDAAAAAGAGADGGSGRRDRRRRGGWRRLGAGRSARCASAARRARPPSCVRPVDGSTGAATAGVGTWPVASACSRTATRAARAPMSSAAAAGGVAASCTRATSTRTRGSGAWRSSVRISPSRSIARTRAAGPRRCAWAARTSTWWAEQLHELGRHQRQEPVAEVAHEGLGQRPRLVAGVDGVGQRGEGVAGVVLDQRLDELVERQGVTGVAAGVGDQLERRQGIARRPGALGDGRVDGRIVDVEPGIGGDPPHVLGQRVGRQEVEAQVLGAAADGVADLLRIGGGQHEHDVRPAAPPTSSAAWPRRPWTACGPRRGCTPCGARACRGRPVSMRSRIASTPLLLAASSSWTS